MRRVYGRLVVCVLECHGERGFVVGRICKPRPVILCECEAGVLVHDDGLSLPGRGKAVGHSLVADQHLQGKAVAKRQSYRPGRKIKRGLPVERGVNLLTQFLCSSLPRLSILRHLPSVVHYERYVLGAGQCLSVEANLQRQLVRCRHHRLYPTVGRAHGEVLCHGYTLRKVSEKQN